MSLQSWLEATFGCAIGAKQCACHQNCLIPGHPRRAGCDGEDPAGCRNCNCFGLVSVPVWRRLAKERHLPPCRLSNYNETSEGAAATVAAATNERVEC